MDFGAVQPFRVTDVAVRAWLHSHSAYTIYQDAGALAFRRQLHLHSRLVVQLRHEWTNEPSSRAVSIFYFPFLDPTTMTSQSLCVQRTSSGDSVFYGDMLLLMHDLETDLLLEMKPDETGRIDAIMLRCVYPALPHVPI